MPIVLTRVDNRLIHGQIGITWIKHMKTDVIVVANDHVAGDQIQQNVMDNAVPKNVKTRYFTIQETIEKIQLLNEDKDIFLIMRTPQEALRLLEGGVPIKKVNIGIMHNKEGKRQVAPTVYVDKEDCRAIGQIMDLGVEVEIRRIPNEDAVPVENIFA